MAEILSVIALSSSLITLLFEILIKRSIDHAYKRNELKISNILDIEKDKQSYIYPKEFELIEDLYTCIIEHISNCYDYQIFKGDQQKKAEIKGKIMKSHKSLLDKFRLRTPFLYFPIKQTIQKIIKSTSFEEICENENFKYREELESLDNQISERLKLKLKQ